MSLRPAAEERAAKELTTGAGGAMTKITEPTARVFIAETVLAAEKMTPMGGTVCVWRTEWIVMLDWRDQYLHCRRRQLSNTIRT